MSHLCALMAPFQIANTVSNARNSPLLAVGHFALKMKDFSTATQNVHALVATASQQILLLSTILQVFRLLQQGAQ